MYTPHSTPLDSTREPRRWELNWLALGIDISNFSSSASCNLAQKGGLVACEPGWLCINKEREFCSPSFIIVARTVWHIGITTSLSRHNRSILRAEWKYFFTDLWWKLFLSCWRAVCLFWANRFYFRLFFSFLFFACSMSRIEVEPGQAKFFVLEMDGSDTLNNIKTHQEPLAPLSVYLIRARLWENENSKDNRFDFGSKKS